jgi:kinesin family protein 15
LIPRVLQRIFQRVEDEKAGVGVPEGEPAPVDVAFTVKCSYLEIYNEQVADLLAPPDADARAARAAPQIREHDKRGVFVEGLTEALVTSAEETYDLFTRGSFNRRVGQTEMNRESSRSHAVFTVTLESRRRAFRSATRRSTWWTSRDRSGRRPQRLAARA